jgi:hypothetical protein
MDFKTKVEFCSNQGMGLVWIEKLSNILGIIVLGNNNPYMPESKRLTGAMKYTTFLEVDFLRGGEEKETY